MNYTKPEVAVLGEAVSVIESHAKGGKLDFDGRISEHPAYDLDE